MAKNNIGGFFVDLMLKPDRGSFETGNKLIDGITTGFNKLIGTARNAAVVLGTTATATSAVETANYKTATALGMSTKALDTWKATAKIAGINANSLLNSMSEFQKVTSSLKIDGSGIEDYNRKLSALKLSFNNIKDLSAEDAYKKIIDTAQTQYNAAKTKKEKEVVQESLRRILGTEGVNLMLDLSRRGITIEQAYADAGKTVFGTEADNAKGAAFATEMATFQTSVESLTKLFGDDIAENLTQSVKDINKWIQDNAGEIKTGIQNISETVGRIAEKIAPYAEDVANIMVGAASGNKEKVNAAGEDLGFQIASDITGQNKNEIRNFAKEKSAIINEIQKYKTSQGYKVNQRIPYDKLPEELQQAVTKFGGKKAFNAIKDGIIRPNGQVTQVAPDDWVIAAKDLSKVAGAFVPQNYASAAPAEIVINQTFNVTGSKDIPQVIKQQAYRGTQDGLQQIMQQSALRMQLMSGTR